MSTGTKGQKFLHCPGTKGQRNKLKILPRNRPGRDFDILPWDGPGWDGILTFCNGTGWDGILTACPGTGHGTEGKKEREKNPFPVLDHPSLVLERPSPVFRTSFPVLEWPFLI